MQRIRDLGVLVAAATAATPTQILAATAHMQRAEEAAAIRNVSTLLQEKDTAIHIEKRWQQAQTAAPDAPSSSSSACGNGCEGEDAQATHWCASCQKAFCWVCVRQHSRIPAMKQHTLLALSKISGNIGGASEKLSHNEGGTNYGSTSAAESSTDRIAKLGLQRLAGSDPDLVFYTHTTHTHTPRVREIRINTLWGVGRG